MKGSQRSCARALVHPVLHIFSACNILESKYSTNNQGFPRLKWVCQSRETLKFAGPGGLQVGNQCAMANIQKQKHTGHIWSNTITIIYTDYSGKLLLSEKESSLGWD